MSYECNLTLFVSLSYFHLYFHSLSFFCFQFISLSLSYSVRMSSQMMTVHRLLFFHRCNCVHNFYIFFSVYRAEMKTIFLSNSYSKYFVSFILLGIGYVFVRVAYCHEWRPLTIDRFLLISAGKMGKWKIYLRPKPSTIPKSKKRISKNENKKKSLVVFRIRNKQIANRYKKKNKLTCQYHNAGAYTPLSNFIWLKATRIVKYMRSYSIFYFSVRLFLSIFGILLCVCFIHFSKKLSINGLLICQYISTAQNALSSV